MTHTTEKNRPRTALDTLAEGFAEAVYEMFPETATTAGRPGHETEYSDHSPAGFAAYARLLRSTLEQIEQTPIEDGTDAVTADAMAERLGLELESIEAFEAHGALNNIASPAQGIRAVFDLMPQQSEEDWAHIAGRMSNLPAAVDGYIASLRLAAEHGVIAARRQVEIVIEQATAYAAEDGFFNALAEQGAASFPALQADLRHGAAVSNEAYTKLVDFLREVLLPKAPVEDAVGRERYQRASRQFLGETVDLDETYDWGLKVLAEIVAEQEALAEQIKPGATIAEAKRILNEDPQRQLHGTEALQSWMQKLSDKAVEDLGRTHFEIPEPLRTLECMIAPTQEGGVYYTGPSDDFSRPGRMWWSVPAGETSFTTWGETSTVYHEGVPGHHLQVATAVYLKDGLNTWRRSMCWTSGHGEGWALYAERLMDELGYLQDPGDRMGMLDAQRMRAARVVFDIGVHLKKELPPEWAQRTGEKVWTAQIGKQFLDEHLDMSEGQRSFEFVRYLGWPGQAPSYKVGQKVWDELRAEAQEQPGFDMKAWHSKALALGSLPLSTLKKAMRGEFDSLGADTL